MAEVRTIFPYMGNKSSIVEHIIPIINQANKPEYAEVFGGTMAVLLNMPKKRFEIYNDFNKNLTNLHEVIRTKKDIFISEVEKLYISENTYDAFYKNIWVEGNEVESAIRYFYVMCLCHLGKFTGGFSVVNTDSYVNKFESKKPIIEAIYKRIKNVIIVNKSYDKIIKSNNRESMCLYLDPPYDSSEKYYEKLAGSFNEAEHIKLRDLLKEFKGTWILSYEASDLIRDLYSDYDITSISKFRQSKGSSAEEVIITNFTQEHTLFGGHTKTLF